MSKSLDGQGLGSTEQNLTQAVGSAADSSSLPPLPRALRRNSSSDTTSKELDEEVAATEKLLKQLQQSAENSHRLTDKIKDLKEQNKVISENTASEKALLNQRLAYQQAQADSNEAKLRSELEKTKHSLEIEKSRAQVAENSYHALKAKESNHTGFCLTDLFGFCLQSQEATQLKTCDSSYKLELGGAEFKEPTTGHESITG